MLMLIAGVRTRGTRGHSRKGRAPQAVLAPVAAPRTCVASGRVELVLLHVPTSSEPGETGDTNTMLPPSWRRLSAFRRPARSGTRLCRSFLVGQPADALPSYRERR